MNATSKTKHLRLAALSTLAAFTIGTPALRAADHGDAPIPSNNQNCDIADVYAFLDPNNQDNVILIATIRGFIAAGENSNFGIFDPNVRYRFDLETTGDAKADKFIDVTFTPRTAIDGPGDKAILQIPQAQKATITFTGFKDATGKKIKAVSDVATTPSSTASTAPTQEVEDIGNGMTFCAGMVDDPFFFDIPAFGAFIQSVRDNAPNPGVFSRARDSFAGYNVMSIAFSIPATLLKGTASTSIGVAFEAQRKIVQNPNKKTGEIKGTGAYRTIDRMGNPAVNVTLIPFNRKNAYNQATQKDDANFKFAADILGTLKALGTTGTDTDPLSGNAAVLASVAVANGDFLRLETDKTAKPNVGTGGGGPDLPADNYGNGFPNGRRLRDDVVDILLSLVTNNAPTFLGGPLPFPVGDGVNSSDPLPQSAFPFLALPNQPFPSGTTDDKTRN